MGWKVATTGVGRSVRGLFSRCLSKTLKPNCLCCSSLVTRTTQPWPLVSATTEVCFASDQPSDASVSV